MNSIGQLDHEGEFQRAWDDPGNTLFEMPPVHVNRVLAEHYRTSEPLPFTRTMLWDMEVRKAWRPDRYISSVVQEGSAHSWGRGSAADGTESFVRSSQQGLWLEPAEYGRVLEPVCLNPRQQKVTFIGAAELPDRDGNLLRAGVQQPLFHVEHSVRRRRIATAEHVAYRSPHRQARQQNSRAVHTHGERRVAARVH